MLLFVVCYKIAYISGLNKTAVLEVPTYYFEARFVKNTF